MDNYSSRLIVINDKVKELLGEIALLKKEKNELNISNLASIKESQALKLQIDDQNEKIQMLKLAKSISGDEMPQESTDLKRKINEYIKEIDRCIALLNE
jgi:hypothetical protein